MIMRAFLKPNFSYINSCCSHRRYLSADNSFHSSMTPQKLLVQIRRRTPLAITTKEVLEVLRSTKNIANRKDAYDIVNACAKIEYLNPETFFLSLQCLRSDIMSAYKHFQKLVQLNPELKFITPKSVDYLMRLLMNENHLSEALSVYASVFQEYSDLSVDVRIANFVLQIFSKSEPINRDTAINSLNILNRLLYEDGIEPDTSTYAQALYICVASGCDDLVKSIEFTMRSVGAIHTPTTRTAMILGASKLDKYELMFSYYNNIIDDVSLPPNKVMEVIVKSLLHLKEHAIATRVIRSWLVHGGRLDWSLMSTFMPLLRERKLVPTLRYQKQQQANSGQTNNSPWKNSNRFDNMKVFLDVEFNENLSDYYRGKLYITVLVSRLLMHRLKDTSQFTLWTGDSSITGKYPYLYNAHSEKNHAMIPLDILLPMAPHITVAGGLDSMIENCKSRKDFNLDNFWLELFDELLNSYVSEWRIVLHVWERVKYEFQISEIVLNYCFAKTIVSLAKNNQITTALEMISEYREFSVLNTDSKKRKIVIQLKESLSDSSDISIVEKLVAAVENKSIAIESPPSLSRIVKPKQKFLKNNK